MHFRTKDLMVTVLPPPPKPCGGGPTFMGCAPTLHCNPTLQCNPTMQCHPTFKCFGCTFVCTHPTEVTITVVPGLGVAGAQDFAALRAQLQAQLARLDEIEAAGGKA